MSMSCSINGCTNNSTTSTNPTVQYHHFPKNPSTAHQWATACWSTEAIDIENAQICSVHFDIDSYTSEYNYVDYLGTYSRVLKDDAIPTLFLPYKGDAGLEPHFMCQPVISVSSGETFYELKHNSDETNNSNLTDEVCDDSGTPNELQNNDKYHHVTTVKELEAIKEKNLNLEEQIRILEKSNHELRCVVETKNLLLKTKTEEVKQVTHDYDVSNRRSLSIAKQKNILSKVFSESQIKILSGKKKIYWSNDDMAVGHTIKALSNARCYMYLNKNLHIPLPALSSLKRWATIKKPENVEEGKQEDLSEFKDESD